MDKNGLILDIPNEPKIQLENYLLSLVEEKDTIGNSLYLYNLGEFIDGIWKEIIDKKKKIGVRKVFPKELGLEPTHFYAIIKDKRGISIQSLYKLLKLWKKYCNKTDDDIKEKWDYVYNSNFLIASFSKPPKLSLPKYLNPKIFYLIGWIVGDGCFDSSAGHCRMKISEKSKEQLGIIKSVTEEVFDVICVVRKDHHGYCLRIYSKPIFRFFRKVLGVKVGEVPKIIKDVDLTNKQFFMRGIFDAEGDVYANYEGSRIRISQASKSFLEQIIKILEEIGISANGPYGPFFKYPTEKWNVFSKWYYIEIRKKSEIIKFIEKIDSSHLNKFPKMQFLSKEIEKRYKGTCSNRNQIKRG